MDLPLTEKFGAGKLQEVGVYPRNGFGSVGACPRKITPIKGYTTTHKFLENQ
jgi:hypothetical protein